MLDQLEPEWCWLFEGSWQGDRAAEGDTALGRAPSTDSSFKNVVIIISTVYVYPYQGVFTCVFVCVHMYVAICM